MQWVLLKRARLVSGLFAAVLVLVGAGDDRARVDRLGHQLMCVCGCNYILLECNHVNCPYSDRMRGELTSAVTRGDDDNTIVHWFVQTYGTVVLLAPTHSGFNRLAWIMPYLALVLGVALVVLIVWMWKQHSPLASSRIAATVPPTELDGFRQQARRETEI
jgi:cytochrome c-type biogenesis protein CcmH